MTSLENLGCYVQGGSVLLPPAYGTWPQNSRGIFRGPSFDIWDMSVTKNIKIKERIVAQFRGRVLQFLEPSNIFEPNWHGASQPARFSVVPHRPISLEALPQTLDVRGLESSGGGRRGSLHSVGSENKLLRPVSGMMSGRSREIKTIDLRFVEVGRKFRQGALGGNVTKELYV